MSEVGLHADHAHLSQVTYHKELASAEFICSPFLIIIHNYEVLQMSLILRLQFIDPLSTLESKRLQAVNTNFGEIILFAKNLSI